MELSPSRYSAPSVPLIALCTLVPLLLAKEVRSLRPTGLLIGREGKVNMTKYRPSLAPLYRLTYKHDSGVKLSLSVLG